MVKFAGSAWTEHEQTRAQALWLEGLSASQIARELNTGRTRNAVIGFLCRAGVTRNTSLPRQTLPPFGKPKRRRTPVKRPIVRLISSSVAVLEQIAELPPIDPTLTIMGLTQFTCRYPIGDPDHPDFTYCGRTCDADRAFCVHHHALCYMPDSADKQERTRNAAEWAARKDKAGHYLAGMGA